MSDTRPSYRAEPSRHFPGEHRVIRRETNGTNTMHTSVAVYANPDIAAAVADLLNAFRNAEVVK